MTRDNAHQAFHPLSSSMQTLTERAETSVPAQEAQAEKQSPYGIWDDEPTERLMPHDDFVEGSASSASWGRAHEDSTQILTNKPCMSSMSRHLNSS